jgi:hypothetical protein
MGQYLRQLQSWLGENFVRVFKIYHEDKELQVTEAIAEFHLTLRDKPFRDQVHLISAALLSANFEAKYPHYPVFEGYELTQTTLPTAAESALRAVDGGPVTQMAQSVLEALQLGHYGSGEFTWKIEESPYAQFYLELVNALDEKKVINRLDLLAGEPGAEHDLEFGLEPELLAVVLAALVRYGALAINLPGIVINEVGQSSGRRLSLAELLRFNSIGKPKAIPELVVRELFTLLDVHPKLLDQVATRGVALEQFQSNLTDELNRVVRMLENLKDGPKFAQKFILPEGQKTAARKALEQYRGFLNEQGGLKTYNRLANIAVSINDVREAGKAQALLEELGTIFEILFVLRPEWEQLAEAQRLLAQDDPWQPQVRETVQNTLTTLSDPEKRQMPGIAGQLKASLENLHASYAKRYLAIHQAARLDREQDAQKTALNSDPGWAKLDALSRVSLLPTDQLQQLKRELNQLKACPNLQLSDLKSAVVCPHCGFIPADFDPTKSQATVADIRTRFDNLVSTWVSVLLSNLKTDEAVQNVGLLQDKQRKAVTDFIEGGVLPDKITGSFLDGLEIVLQGLDIIQIDGTEFLFALTKAGMPCTPDELESRITTFLQSNLAGKDRKKTRVQINW